MKVKITKWLNLEFQALLIIDLLPHFCFLIHMPVDFPNIQHEFVKIAKCICQNCKMYLSKLHNVFV